MARPIQPGNGQPRVGKARRDPTSDVTADVGRHSHEDYSASLRYQQDTWQAKALASTPAFLEHLPRVPTSYLESLRTMSTRALGEERRAVAKKAGSAGQEMRRAVEREEAFRTATRARYESHPDARKGEELLSYAEDMHASDPLAVLTHIDVQRERLQSALLGAADGASSDEAKARIADATERLSILGAEKRYRPPETFNR